MLIELDPTMNDAEREHLQSDFMAARLDVARLQRRSSEAAIRWLRSSRPQAPPPTQVATAAPASRSTQDAEERAKLAELDHQRAQKACRAPIRCRDGRRSSRRPSRSCSSAPISGKYLADKGTARRSPISRPRATWWSSRRICRSKRAHRAEAAGGAPGASTRLAHQGHRISPHAPDRARRGRAEGRRLAAGRDQGARSARACRS